MALVSLQKLVSEPNFIDHSKAALDRFIFYEQSRSIMTIGTSLKINYLYCWQILMFSFLISSNFITYNSLRLYKTKEHAAWFCCCPLTKLEWLLSWIQASVLNLAPLWIFQISTGFGSKFELYSSKFEVWCEKTYQITLDEPLWNLDGSNSNVFANVHS